MPVSLLVMARSRASLVSFACLLACLTLVLTGCGEPPQVRQESYVFGTRVEVLSYGAPEAQAQAALAAVLREFDRLHRAYHAWQPSELTRLNDALARGEAQTVSPELAQLLTRARDASAASEGLFDPAIGRLIELWGFHRDSFTPLRPDPAALQAVLAAHPRSTDLVLDGLRASSPNRALNFDFGGIAKGYALDRAAVILHEHGIRNALVNIGGNVIALGRKGDRPWQVGIQNPRGSGALATLALYDGEAIGTSGDYQRFFELDGRRYSHLIDPRDGQPVQHTQAVTVLITPRADAGLLSDVASKPIFVGGAERWRDMARRMQVEHVLRIDAAGLLSLTAAMRARLSWVGDGPPSVVVE